jgi:hypothetical protein
LAAEGTGPAAGCNAASPLNAGLVAI